MATCNNCSGSGQVEIGTKACSNCSGNGEYLVEVDGKLTVVKCRLCKGTGDQTIYAMTHPKLGEHESKFVEEAGGKARELFF